MIRFREFLYLFSALAMRIPAVRGLSWNRLTTAVLHGESTLECFLIRRIDANSFAISGGNVA